MLDKMWLYGVGAVLVLGLVMPFDEVEADCRTNANGSVTCGTADQMDNGSLNTHNNGNNNNNTGNGENSFTHQFAPPLRF